MEPADKVVSLDMGHDDCYYRIHRRTPDSSAVIYVFLQHLDILPEDCQTWYPGVIRELRRRVPMWNDEWTTLTVYKDAAGDIQSSKDQWQPHHLPAEVLSAGIPLVNFVDLDIGDRLAPRVHRVRYGEREQILKVCPFEYQLRYMRREVYAYKLLSERKCPLVPSISAYVFERSSDQVVGFICEHFNGRHAGPGDLSLCSQSLLNLHSYGVVHGDLNRYNILMTTDGPRFIDLEKAVFDLDKAITAKDFDALQQAERDRLGEALISEEGWGKPMFMI